MFASPSRSERETGGATGKKWSYRSEAALQVGHFGSQHCVCGGLAVCRYVVCLSRAL